MRGRIVMGRTRVGWNSGDGRGRAMLGEEKGGVE